jgi:hypothetical protein
MQKFGLGQTVATPAAIEAIQVAGQEPAFFLSMHVSGNWGTVGAEDQKANDAAIKTGERLMSVYRTLLGVEVWVLTEAVDDDGNRIATTILLPEEY